MTLNTVGIAVIALTVVVIISTNRLIDKMDALLIHLCKRIDNNTVGVLELEYSLLNTIKGENANED